MLRETRITESALSNPDSLFAYNGGGSLRDDPSLPELLNKPNKVAKTPHK